MGLFGLAKRQLLKVIEWTDNSKDTIVHKFKITDRDEIMNSSTLIVRESQAALFIHKGEIADVFGPGTYKLTTENIPFLTKILSLPTGFDSRIKSDIYFVNTKQFIGQKWGTQNPIMMRDADFGNIRLRGFGTFSYKVDDVKTFMREVFGTNEIYNVEDLNVQLKSILIESITDAIAESGKSALDLAANYKEFAKIIKEVALPEFKALGIKLSQIVIENLSLPEDVEKMLDERTKMGVIGDKMGTYTQYKAANAIGDAAKNPSGNNLAGLGIGLGAGASVGGLFNSSLAAAKDEEKPTNHTCVKCGAKISAKTKFCPECGASQVDVCPKCKSAIIKGSKFCPECGEKLLTTKKCTKCGAEVKANAKFCPECGEKL